MTSTFYRVIFVFVLAGLIAACATSPEQQAQRDGDRCAERGWKPGTKEHDDCISSAQNRRDARMDQRHRDLVERPAPVYGSR